MESDKVRTRAYTTPNPVQSFSLGPMSTMPDGSAQRLNSVDDSPEIKD
jgi:hypothetical protein